MPLLAPLDAGQAGEIAYTVDPHGRLTLPSGPGTPSLQWTVEGPRGAKAVEIAFVDAVAGPHARASAEDLLARWRRGEALLDPVLLALARACIEGVPISEAARTPAPDEPVPGIRILALRTPTLPPATHTNCVLVGERDLVVVDPASPDPGEQARLDEAIEAATRAGRRAVAVVLTHHHIDHVADARRVQERLGVPICAHSETATRLEGTLAVDRLLGDDNSGDLGVEAWFTPGHAPGHLCLFYAPARTLLAGDMVAGEGTILISPRDDGDMGDYLASLEALAARDLGALVPAHGAPTAKPRALLEGTLAHRRAREARVLEALARAGAATAEALVPDAYSDTASSAWPLAALSVEAHLEHLEKQGKVVREGQQYRLLPNG